LLDVIVRVRNPLVIEAEQVHDGRLEVIWSNDVLHGFMTEFICLAVRDSAFDSTASEPDAEALAVMISACPFWGTVVLSDGQTSDFTTPVD
jgi:hypothetical protein